jgi:hypothetical protein
MNINREARQGTLLARMQEIEGQGGETSRQAIKRKQRHFVKRMASVRDGGEA